jgi:hypothetical protein
VADAIDKLVTTITDSRVADVAAGIAEEVRQSREGGVRDGGRKRMAWMVAVLVAHVAVDAQIVVLTGEASDELVLWHALDAAIACASRLLVADDRLLLVGKGPRHVLCLLRLGLGRHALGGAVYDATILDKALDHPVARAGAVNAGIDTSGTKIIVSAITNSTVEVLVLHGMITVVAVHDPGGASIVRLWAEREISVVGRVCEVAEEA